MDILLIIAACLAAPLLPLSFILKNYKLDRVDQRVKGKVIGRDRREGSVATTEGEVRDEEDRKHGFWARLKR